MAIITLPLTEPRFIQFPDYPAFKPLLTPRQCLELGVFGGIYFYSVKRRTGLPKELFDGLPALKYKSQFPNYDVNYFKIWAIDRHRSHLTPYLAAMHASWFEWYSRFFNGQRGPADEGRIKEWLDELETFSFYIRMAVLSPEGWADANIKPLWRQYLLQYAWEPFTDPKEYKII